MDLTIACYPARTDHRNESIPNGAQVTSVSLSISNELFLLFQSMEENGKALAKLLLEVIGDLQQCQKIWNKFFIRWGVELSPPSTTFHRTKSNEALQCFIPWSLGSTCKSRSLSGPSSALQSSPLPNGMAGFAGLGLVLILFLSL